MSQYCETCKRIPLLYESEYDFGQCYDCQDHAIAKWERMRDWHEFHGDYHDELAGCDSDRSGEAGETCSGSTEGESAGPKDIAQ